MEIVKPPKQEYVSGQYYSGWKSSESGKDSVIYMTFYMCRGRSIEENLSEQATGMTAITC